MKSLLISVGLLCCYLPFTMAADSSVYEKTLLDIVKILNDGDLNAALNETNKHLQQYPKSRLGYLLKADIIKAMSSQLSGVAGGSQVIDESAVTGLKHQLKNRWVHDQQVHVLAEDRIPANLIDIGQHAYVVVSDLQEGRLYLYRNNQGKPEFVKDYYMSVGSAGYGKQVEGDNKTPIGVYSVYKYIDGLQLPDLYGKGAFPVNYPNRVDRYRQRTGYGIWLHGTPSNTYARSPWASEGCFVLSNDDFLDISQYLNVKEKTPVVLVDAIEWVTWDELQNRRNAYLTILADWKQAWESLDTNAYLDHYEKRDLNFGKLEFSKWADRKKQINRNKTFIQVDFDIQSLFVYPGEKDMFVVKYKQRYMSNNFHSESNKEQYWQRNNQGQWQIIYEG